MKPVADKDTTICSAAQRFLIVDDEPAILFAYRKLLEREGFTVDICDSLLEAEEKILAVDYIGVIADLRLRGTGNLDGLTILRFVRKEQPHAKVILATGYGNSEIEQTALSLGAFLYLEKPVLPSVILNVLKAIRSSNITPLNRDMVAR